MLKHSVNTVLVIRLIGGFEKEMMGFTGGFPGGEKGLRLFIEKNPLPIRYLRVQESDQNNILISIAMYGHLTSIYKLKLLCIVKLNLKLPKQLLSLI